MCLGVLHGPLQHFGWYFLDFRFHQDWALCWYQGFHQRLTQKHHPNFLQGFHQVVAESFGRVNSVAVAVARPMVVVVVAVALAEVAEEVAFVVVAAAVVAVVVVVALFAFAMCSEGCLLNWGPLDRYHCHPAKSQAQRHLQ